MRFAHSEGSIKREWHRRVEAIMKTALLIYVEAEGSQECDVSINQIEAALRGRGHEVTRLFVHADLAKLVAMFQQQKFDLVFNLLEQFGESGLGIVEATGVLDLLEVPYTGSSAGELYLQQDKALTKKLLAYEKI